MATVSELNENHGRALVRNHVKTCRLHPTMLFLQTKFSEHYALSLIWTLTFGQWYCLKSLIGYSKTQYRIHLSHNIARIKNARVQPSRPSFTSPIKLSMEHFVTSNMISLPFMNSPKKLFIFLLISNMFKCAIKTIKIFLF